MSEKAETKVCPMCAETIKAAAKVCPHCRKIQMRWLFITRYDWLVLAAVALFIGTLFLFIKLVSGGRSFSSSRDKITVLDSQLAVDAGIGYTNVVVSGVLTNSSDYAWQLGEFEVRFLDGSGKIVDVRKGFDRFTVLPRSDHSFHLTLFSGSIPEHASRKIMIRSAKDPNAWFASD